MDVPSLKDVIDWYPLTATPNIRVTEILQLMRQPKMPSPLTHSVFPIATEVSPSVAKNCIAIVTPTGQLVGLLTERELVRAMVAGELHPDVTAGEVMERAPLTLKLGERATLLTALDLFQQYPIQYLPVVDEQGNLQGMLSLSQVFQQIDPRSLYQHLEQLQQLVTEQQRHHQLEQLVRKRTTQLHQANRALKTLSECNQILVRATAEAELLHDICQVILETGGYRLAWIGFATPETGAGAFAGEMEDLGDYFSINDATGEEADAIAIALRTGKPCVIRYDTPSTYGYGAVLSLPLKDYYASNAPAAPCFGTLNIYATPLDAFDSAEVQLLSKLAADLAYGIKALRTRTERETAQQELDRFFELSLDWLFVSDFNGYFQRINPAVSKTLGYRTEQLLEVPWLEFVHKSDRANTQAELQKLCQGQATVYFENRFCAADGSYRWMAWTAVPVMAQRAIYGVARDVTERKWAQDALLKSQQKLTLHVQQTPLAVIEWNLRGEVTEWNPAAEEIFGYSKAEVLGRCAVNFLVPKELRPTLRHLLSCLLSGKTIEEGISLEHFELEVADSTKIKVAHENLTKDGRLIICEWYNTPLVDRKGQIIGVASLALDITERKQAEQALQLANEALELRVVERTAELVQTLEQLQAEIHERQRLEVELRTSLSKEKELNELKSRFVSMVSHDFRTPLTTIQSSAELLEHYGPQWSEEKKRIHLHRMQTSVHRMTQLLEDILTIGRAEAGKLEFQPKPLDLRQFAVQLVEEMQLLSSAHTLVFCSSGQYDRAIADEKLLHHIFSNLLSNAIKYSVVGSLIEFELICPDSPQGEVVFCVRDRGIGIPPEDIPMLFTAFHRCSNANHIAGTGLGLTIVKKCVDLHGGAISLESQLGIGTVFTVTLPLEQREPLD
ncbi:PAS domain S-box protein [Kamptonema cortianum]|uniref:histidine kinase n=1 Tax=Geitlerinema calcuttense NRMC-F 0142 TaxID=2922238 RepID=A0ABT7LXR0_9CYAN|nr:PAS domain S-box protein [Geitlerinema calcuttense]MDK3155443.1 PAS domain S-box protein [Kamptonema cortianum]MDL5056783.1 PAS domain S-box protein [Geitlerinema calcuttense NRMC-F 0142]